MKGLRQTALLAAIAAILLGATGLYAEEGITRISELRGLQLQNAKLPVFHNGKLQMVIFSDRAERRSETTIGYDTVLAIIRKGADADEMLDDWKLKPYPLGAPLPQVLDFWKERIVYCDGIMNTPVAEIDDAHKGAWGDRDVHFRSPIVDLDGVGFEANFGTRTITVKSQIRIRLRMKSADPAELLRTPGKLPAKYEYVTAESDSLLIDSEHKEFMLIGNVRVVEARGVLTCRRLTIFWGDRESGGKDKNNGKTAVGMDFDGADFDRLLADGDVVITSRANPKDRALADHLVVDVRRNTATLTGDDKFPRLVSADGDVVSGREIQLDLGSRLRMRIVGGCRIEGAPETNAKGEKTVFKVVTSDSAHLDDASHTGDLVGKVRMRDGSRVISCDRVRLVTADDRSAPAPAAKEKNAETGSLFGAADFGVSGKGVKSADFYGKVDMRDGGGLRLECDRMHIDFVSGKTDPRSADFHGHVKASDPSGAKLECDTGHVDFAPRENGGTDIARAQWSGHVRGESVGTKTAPAGSITAERGEFDNRAQRVSFDGNVNARREKSTLKCRRLDLYLNAKKNAGTPSGSIAIGAGKDLSIKNVVAVGKVKMTDEAVKLDCDKLTLFFTELPPGAKPAPGMFQAGGARLTDILAEGHLVGVNRASSKSAGPPGLVSGKSSGDRKLYADRGQVDLLRNLSHFTGNVRISDDESCLLCDDMFIYGVRAAAPAPAGNGKGKGKAAPENPDDDPFALPGFTEDDVPAVINVTDDVQLKKVLCLGNVKMQCTERGTKRKQEAGGDRCVYIAEKRTATLTATPPRRPWLRVEVSQRYGSYGSRIVYDFGEGIFKSYDSDTFTIGK